MLLPQLCWSVCLRLECLSVNVASESWDVRGSPSRRSISDAARGVAGVSLGCATSLRPGVQSRILALPAGSGTPSVEGGLRVLLSVSGNGFNLCFD